MDCSDRPCWLLVLLVAALAGACRPPGPAPQPEPAPRQGIVPDPTEPGAPASARDDLTGIPAEVVAGLATCEVALTLELAAGGAETGMRSVRLVMASGESRVVPDEAFARWPDGSLRTAGAGLRRRYLVRALGVLAQAGFFERAAGEVAPEPGARSAVDLAVSVDDGAGERRRWVLRATLDEAALELLWDLAVVLHEDPDVEAYAHLSALYNRAVDAVTSARATAPP